MMKNILIFPSLIFLFVIYSCDKEGGRESYSFDGKVQKGPFIAGTNVTVNELNSDFGQSGKVFTTTVLSDDGSFSLNNVGLDSRYVLLTGNGFYFNEIYGTQSPASLSLQAISDLENLATINVNIMTHLITERIFVLKGEGLSFAEARDQAQTELMTYLGADDSQVGDFDQLDISEEGDANAFLLAASVMAQRFTNRSDHRSGLTAELTWLLARLSSDLGDNGIIDNKELTDTILHNISRLNLLEIRENIEARYATLGVPNNIPEFEQCIFGFQKKHCDHIYDSFTYPDMATPELIYPESKLPNILVPSDTVFMAGQPYSIAAIVPLGSSLTVKFISNSTNNNYVSGSIYSGWLIENHYPDGFTFHSQRCNDLMTTLFYLENPGEARLEYYENGAEIPGFTKTIRWQNNSD